MADIQLRFHKDMLVLTAPVDFALERQGIDMAEDAEYISLMEPETVRDALRYEVMAGAQCLVTNTEGICPARLAHKRVEDRIGEFAQAALAHAAECRPQHVICEIGACGLPLDPSSEASMEQSTDQYARAAAAFGKEGFDAILLNGMRSVADIQCAIAGVRRVYEGPVMVSVNVDADGLHDGKSIDGAVEAMAQADVVGFAGEAPQDVLCDLVRRAAVLTDKPILVQIGVRAATAMEKRRASLGGAIPGKPYALPDALADAALALRAAGAQFLRATGEATPAYTGALVVATMGADCVR